MPRRLRIQNADVICHVMARAHGRQHIVQDDHDRQRLLESLARAVQRKNVTIDWNVKESARAKMRTIIKRLLRKYGYPPDKQEKATQTVMEQAELICERLAA